MVLDSKLINISNYVRYLGGGLDSTLSFKKHVGVVCRKAMANFICIRSTRQFLNREACETLLLGLCISHFDYSNAMLPDVTINRLQ